MPDTREIFSLRKAGNIEEAYRLALQAYEESPNDEWVLRAVGWVLYDKLKAALQQRDQEAIVALTGQLQQLNIPAADEMLFTNVNRLIEQAQPHRQRLAEARKLEEEGQLAPALAIFRELKDLLAGDAAFAESYGWCIYKNLKQLMDNEAGGIGAYRQLLDEYLLLHNARPSRLHSNMLRLAEKLSEDESFPFPEIFFKWGYQNFQEEDWNKNVWQEKSYPGLAEKTIQACAKKLLQQGSEQAIDQFDPALDIALQKIDDNIWLFYYKAKLLIKVGRNEAAEAFLKPVVKQKRSEYWTWTFMGDIYRETSVDKALSCYCKALLCGAEEKFLTKSRVILSELMVQKGLFEEAKTELLASIRTRDELGYTITNDLLLVQQQDWFVNATAKENNWSFYLENKLLAEEILFADLPWISATIGESYTLPADPRTTRVKLYFNDRYGLKEIAVKDKIFKITRRFRPGDAVQLKAESLQGKWQVYLVEKRAEGKRWETFPEYVGVIDHVNEEKRIAHFLVDKIVDGIIQMDGKALAVGDFLKLRLKKRMKDQRTIYEVVNWSKTSDVPGSNAYKIFQGEFVMREGNAFGFVDDIFIEPSLVKRKGLNNRSGVLVTGNAVISYNKSKNSWSWKALTIGG